MLNKEEFLERYSLHTAFANSGLTWNVLEAIFEDYTQRQKDLQICKETLERYIKQDMPPALVHSIRARVKLPEHLIEKIIRKRGTEQSKKYEKIDVSDYRDIVHDLLGLRILILSKEEWEPVYNWVAGKFPQSEDTDVFMAEEPMAYTRYGDRDIFGDKIHKEHTNIGYRSQHYVVRFHDYYCEIQVRTLSEEVYGEFDHRVKYPYRNNNHFLNRYTSSVSQMLDSVDEMISTCFQMGESGWMDCEKYFQKDEYIDWQHTTQKAHREELVHDVDKYKTGDQIDAMLYANAFLLRKETKV